MTFRGKVFHDPDSDDLAAPQQANTTDTGSPGNDQFEPQIVALPDGGFVVYWTSTTDGGPDGDATGTDVIGQPYDIQGNKVGAEFLAFATGGNEGDFVAGVRPNGSIVFVEEDDRFDINGNNDGTVIRFAVTTADGSLLAQNTIANASLREDLGGRSVLVLGDGSFMIGNQNRLLSTDETRTSVTVIDAAGPA